MISEAMDYPTALKLYAKHRRGDLVDAIKLQAATDKLLTRGLQLEELKRRKNETKQRND